MKTLVVYFSKFGNTKRVAEAVAEVMRQAGEARIMSIDQLAASDFEGADLVIMGSPTHGFTVPQEVRAVLEAFPQGSLSGRCMAAFDTTVGVWPLKRMRASPKLLGQLSRLGGKPVAQPETFFIRARNPQKTGEVDLLLEGEIERARQWAAEILDKSKALVKA